MSSRQRLSLGESLVQEGLIAPEQLKQAQAEEKGTGQRLGKVLVKKGWITEEGLVAFLSDKLNLPKIELGNYLIDPKIVALVPEELAKKHEVIPVLKIGNRLTCAMMDPWNVFALDELAAKTRLVIEPVVATQTEIKKALDEHYGARGSMEEVLKTIQEKKIGGKNEKEAVDPKKLDEVVKEPLVIKLVNLILMDAARQRASDIHIEPGEETLKIRFRVDGFLHETPAPPKHLQSAIISRIKVMANLDIAERRIPQDGRFNIKLENRRIDVRVSSVPAIYGENVVLRLLDVSGTLLSLSQIGFSSDELARYKKLITRPHGIILVAGPTGSGKTTTLYSSLNQINQSEKNIVTIEDPIEYRLSGVCQIQVNLKANLTFASGLRSVLRQDPDIIMLGEIRDFETAEIAIQAALTGHLVFSTLHTNDAPGAITRLIDMGVEPYLVSSAVIGFLAQRLLRTICPDCKESIDPSSLNFPSEEGKKMMAEIGRAKIYRGKGCEKCLKTGYKGRIAIFELMIPDEKIAHLTIAKATAEEIKKQALVSGMTTLKEDGIRKVKEGLTTLEEVLRITQEE